MKQDKQTENDARLFFDDILQKTNFIEKLRSVTREVRDKLSQFDPRKTEKITYPCEYLFTVILLAGMAGFKSKHDVWMFWQANSDIFSEVFPDLFGEMPSTSTRCHQGNHGKAVHLRACMQKNIRHRSPVNARCSRMRRTGNARDSTTSA